LAVSVPSASGEDIIDYHVRLTNQGALEDFANALKDALVTRMRASERFSGIRLKNTALRYNDFMNPTRVGEADYKTNTISVRETTGALDLADTVIHECAHMLVGPVGHNEEWRDACAALGLVFAGVQDLPALGHQHQPSTVTDR